MSFGYQILGFGGGGVAPQLAYLSRTSGGTGESSYTYDSVTWNTFTFKASGTLTVYDPDSQGGVTVDILCVGGGGAGGYAYGGGGGSGGIMWATGVVLAAGAYLIVVGTKGTGDQVGSAGENGGATTFINQSGTSINVRGGYAGGGGSNAGGQSGGGGQASAATLPGGSSGGVFSQGGAGGTAGASAGGFYFGGAGGHYHESGNPGTQGPSGGGGTGKDGGYTFVTNAAHTKALLDNASLGEAVSTSRYVTGSGGGAPSWQQTLGVRAGGRGGGGNSSANMAQGSGGSPAATDAGGGGDGAYSSGGGGGGQTYGSYDAGNGASGAVVIRSQNPATAG